VILWLFIDFDYQLNYGRAMTSSSHCLGAAARLPLTPFLSLAVSSWLLLAGCEEEPRRSSPLDAASPEDGGTADSGAPEDGGVAPIDAAPASCEPHDVTCVDESIASLDLFDTVSPGAIVEEGTSPGVFVSWIDATGGGLTPAQSYVYARFTDAGLEKVAVSDEDAFTSQEWDIAFRRYVIRLNSGIAGPGCVTGARTAPATVFDDVVSVPEALSFRTESYLTDTCEIVPDGAGLGSPATALSSFWSYPGCVQMTGNVYVIALADGRHVKLRVRSYYSIENQVACDETGSVPLPSMAGNIRIEWAFVMGG
jgi:hypothetical protein